MAFMTVNGVRLYCHASGDESRETLVFSHGYLMTHAMFDAQVAALNKHFHCVAFDHRGHGQSDTPKHGYEMNQLVDDAIDLIESLNRGPVHFLGMSTGGFVGMRIALKRPDLLKSLVLMDTSAEGEPWIKIPKYRAMTLVMRTLGLRPLMPLIMHGLFYRGFLKDTSRKAQVDVWKSRIANQSADAMARFGLGIFSRDNVLSKLGNIDLDVAVIVGTKDTATRPACSKRMVKAINGARLYLIDDGAHTCAIEKPDEVSHALVDFYKGMGAISADT